jgi:hypothetical protein
MIIKSNLKNAAGYAGDALFHNWKRWIFLIIGAIIFPVLSGYSVKVMSGEDPAPSIGNVWHLFVDGIKLLLISIAYIIVPVIILIFTCILSVVMGYPTGNSIDMNIYDDNPLGIFLIFPGLIISIAFFLILCFIVSLYSTLGCVKFSKTGKMSMAFDISDIHARIGRIGWGKYIVALIALWIVVGIIEGIISLISLPEIMWLTMLNILISVIIAPLITIFTSRYYSLLYNAGDEVTQDRIE